MPTPIILFDGVCNLCNGAVQFLIKGDTKSRLLFASLQSSAGQRLLQQHRLSQTGFDSFVFIEKGKAYQQSTAALRLIPYLPWYWQWARVLWIFPAFIRDAVYRLIARNRYRWFGKKEACMVPAPALKERFLT